MVTGSPQQGKEHALGDWALRSQRVLTPDGLRPAAVLIRGERIAAVAAPGAVPAGWRVEDVGERVLLPGLVDAHVHINEPGRTEWEGFETATHAAAAGGITTLIDMPLNSSPVTTTPAALSQKLQAAAGKLWVDVGFYGGIVPGNAEQVEPLGAAGVLGFKAFLCHSGIDEFPNATEADLRAALPKLAAAGLPLLVHAELVGQVANLPVLRQVGNLPHGPHSGDQLSSPRSYAAYLASRPRQWEHDAIRLILALGREYGCHVHIVHLSSADALPMIAQARDEGIRLTVETCPHYLFFAAEEIPDRAPLYKCAPPIRERENRERLWEGLRAGLIDTIGSDHSPAPPELKHLESGDLMRAWGGIASLQLLLPAVWTSACRRGMALPDMVTAMSRRPAELVGLASRKGSIAAGCDADLVVFDPDAEWTVEPALLHYRHRATPYQGQRLRGRVEKTFLRGRAVYEMGRFHADAQGRTILQRASRSH